MTGNIVLPTNLSPFETFTLPENFILAWQRVRYFDRPDSRDWIGLKVFAANRDYNIEALRQSVINRTFEPTHPEIKYNPKASLTLRPMAILPTSDRIVFQAIANVIAEKARPTLDMISNRQSYANILTKSGETPFFVHWKKQYKGFQEKFTNLINDGNKWLAETDAAAFYETIDHNLLKGILLTNGFLDDKTCELLIAYLRVWCSIQAPGFATRGVPQGCLASDLLANVFLSEFDHDLASKEFYYLRYVDDIRILAKTKDEVLRGLIQVDMKLKALSVLLQTKKTTVREITDVSQEIDRLASLLSEIDQHLSEGDEDSDSENDPLLEPSLHDVALLGDNHKLDKMSLGTQGAKVQEELRNIFWKAKNSIDQEKDKTDDPFAERHIRFCLYRLDPDLEIVDAILPYFVERPWLNQIIGIYLGKCALQPKQINFLINIIESHKVYDNVVSTAIEILLGQKISLRTQNDMLRQWVVEDKRSWTLLCNVLIVLGELTDNMSVILHALNSRSQAVRRMALIQALRLARNQNEVRQICQTALKDRSPLVTDTLLYLMYDEHSLRVTDISGHDVLPDYCITMAKGYDESLPEIQPDYIRLIFLKRYEVNIAGTLDFHIFFGAHYERAAYFLWQAEQSFLVNPSRYATQLNLFHEELLFPLLIDKLKLKKQRTNWSPSNFTIESKCYKARKGN